MRGQFDIFAESLDNQPLWLEATDGLKTALHRMEQRATAKPGRYFVYSTDSRAVVASIDTDTGEENHPSKPRV